MQLWPIGSNRKKSTNKTMITLQIGDYFMTIVFLYYCAHGDFFVRFWWVEVYMRNSSYISAYTLWHKAPSLFWDVYTWTPLWPSGSTLLSLRGELPTLCGPYTESLHGRSWGVLLVIALWNDFFQNWKPHTTFENLYETVGISYVQLLWSWFIPNQGQKKELVLFLELVV